MHAKPQFAIPLPAKSLAFRTTRRYQLSLDRKRDGEVGAASEIEGEWRLCGARQHDPQHHHELGGICGRDESCAKDPGSLVLDPE